MYTSHLISQGDSELIIKNNTNHVVVVRNNGFIKEIAIGEVVTINTNEINGDYNFEFSFFSFRKEQYTSGVEIKHAIKGVALLRESQSDIPLITKTNVEHCEKIVLNEISNTFLFMYWTFRITNLKRIDPEIDKLKTRRKCFSFYNCTDKKKFLKRTAIEGVITLFISIILFITMYMTSENWTDRLIYLIPTACFFTSAVRKLLFSFFARRWNVN